MNPHTAAPAHPGAGGEGPGGGNTRPIPPLRPRRRWPVATLAILVGLLCGLPHILIPLRLRAEGKHYAPLVTEGVSALTYDEVTYYASRIRDVLDGHPLSADFTSLEHKGDTPYLGQSWLDSLCLGILGLALGRSVPAVYVFCDFVLPPLAFLLLFGICRRLGAPDWVAMAAGVVAVFAHDQVTFPIALAAHPSLEVLVERLHLASSVRPLEWCRLNVPQAASLPTLGAILGLLTVYDQPRLRRALFTGVLLGATFYCYLFYWSFALVGGGLLLLASLVTRAGRRATLSLAVALGIGLVIGAPVIYQGLSPTGFAAKTDLMARLSWGGRQINWGNQKHDLLLLALILALYPKRSREVLPLLAFAFAPFACILGARMVHLNTQDWHWLGRCWQPWSAVTTVMMLWAWVVAIRQRRARRAGGTPTPDPVADTRAERRLSWGFGTLAAVVLLYAAQTHIRFSADMAQAHTLPPAQRQALQELHLRAPCDSVVLCLDADALALIPVLTHCNVYLPYCIMSAMPTAEIIDRAGAALAAYGVSQAATTRLLQYPRDKSWDDIVMHRNNCEDLANWLFHQTLPQGGTPPKAERAIRGKMAFYGPDGLRRIRNRYRVDFIWWGPLERSVGQPALERKLAAHLFIDAGDVKVYRAPPPTSH